MAVNDLDVLEVTVIHDNDPAGEQINRLQYRLDTPASVAEATVLDDVKQLVETLYLLIEAVISVRNVLREVKVFNVTQNKLLGSTDADSYVGGTGADPALPAGVAPFVHFVTDVPRVILSKYLPSTNEASTAGAGRLTSPAVTAVTAYGTVLMNTQFFGTRGYDFGYFSPKVLDFVLPQVMVVRNVLAYQRRRKEGVGS